MVTQTDAFARTDRPLPQVSTLPRRKNASAQPAGGFSKSIQALERCIQLDPQSANAHMALGFSYARNEQLRKAVEVLQKAVALEPDNFHALKNLGSVHGKLGQFDEAIEAFKAADEVQPDTPEVLYGLALAYERKGREDIADLIFHRIIDRCDSEQFTEMAKEALTRLGMDTLKTKGPRYDAVMYCLGALQKFSDMPLTDVQRATFEIAALGQGGLDINSPTKTYHLQSLPGAFTGLQLLCTLYVGFKFLDPSVDVGADLSNEYEAALELFRGEGP